MSDAPSPSAAPCGTCPYRRDVPSGIWAATEYAKLPIYDGDTTAQLNANAFALFYCHQNDGHLCAGWVGCHDTDNLLALRFNRADRATFDYQSPVPLFASGAEAARHGMRDIDAPGPAAQTAMAKLFIKRITA